MKIELVPSVTIRLGKRYFTIMNPFRAPIRQPKNVPIRKDTIQGAPARPSPSVITIAR